MQYISSRTAPFLTALTSAVARFLRAKRLANNSARRNARAEWRERSDADRYGIRAQVLLEDLYRVSASRRQKAAHEAVEADARLCARIVAQPDCPQAVRAPLLRALIAAGAPIAPANAVYPRSHALGTARYRACGEGRKRTASRARIEITSPNGAV